MLSLERPLGRPRFLAAGVGLLALKVPIDFAVARAFGQPYSVLFYLSPTDSPLLRPWAPGGYWLATWAVALPFIFLGLVLTVRRLRDAGLSEWLAALFFLPIANLLFFAALAALPSRPSPEGGDERRPRETPMGFWRAAVVAGELGALIGFLGGVTSLFLFGQYGAALFLGSPVLTGFVSTRVFASLRPLSIGGAVLSAALAYLLPVLALVLFAYEGFVCLAMAMPLVAVSSAIGVVTAFALAAGQPRPKSASPGAALAILPLLFLAERLSPLPRPDPAPVESAIVVDAPPDVVWRRVIAFPPLPEPTEWIFRAGVAAPMGARIEGEGVGAVRRCEFTTGTFVEPIEVWEPGRELAFAVVSSPDPMREWTLWKGPRPPHLDGYLESTRGQFLLEELPEGRTRLVGRTWYRTNMVPEAYWRLWADAIIHAIHMRVLRHVAALAEADARGR